MVLTTKILGVIGAVILADIAVATMVALALIFADVDFIGLAALVSAVGSAIAAIYAAKAHAASLQNAMSMVTVKEDMATAKTDIRKVEIATNSMKDALMVKTEEEALARGIRTGTAEEKARNKGNDEPIKPVVSSAPAPAIAPVHMEVENMNVDTLNVPEKDKPKK